MGEEGGGGRRRRNREGESVIFENMELPSWLDPPGRGYFRLDSTI